MNLLARMRSFWRNAVYRSNLERNMSDELQFHLVARANDLVERRGLSPEEALRIARVEFGSVEKYKEEARQSLGLRLLDEGRGDLRYAFRTLRKSKGFAAAAVAMLALGIGAITAIFSVMNAVILRPLPVQRPQELVAVLIQRPARSPSDGFTNALWEAIREQQDVFSDVFAWSVPRQLDLAQGGTVRPVQVLMVSGDFFTALGITPGAGRLIAADDDHRGCTPVAVLSDPFSRQHFGGADSALGSSIALSQQSFQVIGVSPPHFFGVNVGKSFDVAIPLCASALFDKRNLDSRGRSWLSIIGRVRPGITPQQVEARLGVLSPAVMAAALPEGDSAFQQEYLKRTLVTAPGGTGASELRRVSREPLNGLMAIVALVLVIACANIAGLMLARAATRGKEVAVRAALGASRGRLIRQLLTESAILSFSGAALGLLFANWGSALLVQSLSTEGNPLSLDLSLDGRVLGFTVTVAIATAMLVGLLPALRSTRSALIEAMKARSGAGEQRSGFRVGKWIVAGQVALSLVLLVAGGLLLRTFEKLITLDLGFDRSHVLVVSARPPTFAADTAKLPLEQKPATYDEIARRLRTIPGVISVARSYTTPIGDDNWLNDIHTDLPSAPSGDEATSYLNFVTPRYFQTMRTPLVAGRDFDEHDTKNSSLVAIVNETLARTFFPGGSALGGRFRRGGEPGQVEIVGIVKDSKYESVRQATPPTAFLPATQMPPRAIAEEFVLRTAVPPATVITTVRQIVADVSKDVGVTFHTLAKRIDDDLVQERLVAMLSGFFGVVALLLAMIGLYGVLSYLVAERQVEFGIRMAIGAQPASILRLVMRDVLAVLAGGLATGLAVTLASVKLLERMLFGLEPRDTATMVTAVCLLSAMALLAGYLPARRATRVDPMIALRSE